MIQRSENRYSTFAGFPSFAIVLILLLYIGSAYSQDEGSLTPTSDPFENIELLRSQGKYKESIEILRAIVANADQPPEILQRAYSEIVFTYMLDGDWQSAEAEARAALKLFPAIQPDARHVPPLIGEIFTRQREAIFGSIRISTIPDQTEVFMNGKPVGHSPLTLDYVESGEVNLLLKKPGFRDLSIDVIVTAGNLTNVKIPLQSLTEQKVEKSIIRGGGLGCGAIALVEEYKNFEDFGITPYAYFWYSESRLPFLKYKTCFQMVFLNSKTLYVPSRYIKISPGLEISDPELWLNCLEPYFSVGAGAYNVWSNDIRNIDLKFGFNVTLGTRIYFSDKRAVDFAVSYDGIYYGREFENLRLMTLGGGISFGRNKSDY
ncbi:MAG: PEGA domain-containing protein [Candidatus Krumholzibacteriota bacterium]|nr:PEGA domain-containing protein [Candidatus Krumholzibacteriota bacterium]